MKIKLKRAIASTLVVAMLFAVAPLSEFLGLKLNLDWLNFNAKANAYSGKCGENVTWELNGTGELVISGTGEMNFYCIGYALNTFSEDGKSGNYEPTTELVTEPVTEPYTEPFTEATTEPQWEPTMTTTEIYPDLPTEEPTTEPTTETTTETTTGWDPDNHQNQIPWYEYRNDIRKVIIADGVTSIADFAFMDCINLVRINIADSVTSIGYRAFEGCYNLFGVVIPDSVASIGGSAFHYCINLTSVTIPNSVTDIGSSAFNDCYRLTEINVDESNTAYSSDDFGVLFNKDKTELIQYPAGNSRNTYEIPDSVTSIGEEAFYECSNLENILIPDSVLIIGQNAFTYSGCFQNKSNWKNGVLYIGNHLIKAKPTVSGDYVIEEGSVSIADYAFYGCNNLTGITIPNSVTSIGSYAFYECRGLTSVTIPDGVTSIGECAFALCESLTSIIIPDSITSMGAGVFLNTGYYCDDDNYENDVLYIGNYLIDAKENLSGEYMIKEGTRSIDLGAFYGCDSLVGITIPDTVIRIGDYAFYDCGNLVSVNIPDSIINIGYGAFALCSGLTDIAIPDNVTSLGDVAFAYCDNLTEATIGGGITEISYGAFGYCTNLATVTIKGSITNIGDYAFSDCNRLKTVYYSGTRADWSYITIGEYNDPLINATLICMGDTHECEYGKCTVIVEPTATTNGEKVHSCIECGEAETVIIPATGFETADGVAIDFATNTISGFHAGETSLDSYTTIVGDGYTWSYETSNGKLGTGSNTILKDGDTVIAEYTILVYGDTNGDSWYDGQDAIIVDCLANGMLTKEDVSEAVYVAADCNHDGVIDRLDVDLLNQAGALLSNVDQSKSSEELLETSSVYVEYLDLIEQSPETEVEDDETTENEATEDESNDSTPVVENSIFAFIFEFIAMLEKLFNFILSFVNV